MLKATQAALQKFWQQKPKDQIDFLNLRTCFSQGATHPPAVLTVQFLHVNTVGEARLGAEVKKENVILRVASLLIFPFVPQPVSIRNKQKETKANKDSPPSGTPLSSVPACTLHF